MKLISTLRSTTRPFARPLGLALTLLLGTRTALAAPLGTEFTYQGRLDGSSGPANGRYDFTFALHLTSSGGTPVGNVTVANVPVTNGLFTTAVDFGAGAFNGNAYWLQLSVRTNGNGTFAAIAPRQPLTSTPNAQFAVLASSVPNGSIDSSKLAANAVSTTALQNNSVLGTKIANAQVVRNVNGLQDAVTLAAGANTTITPAGNTLTIAGSSDWKLGGNAGTTPGVDFVGTSDSQPFEIKVNSARALRLEPRAASPNVIGGFFGNTVIPGAQGALIAGGGNAASPNRIGGDYASILGGFGNSANGLASSAIGQRNTAGGDSSVAMGFLNSASGAAATAMGASAQANHNNAFVWSDGSTFASTAPNQFLIHSAGGVGINDNNPNGKALAVGGDVAISGRQSFGQQGRQMLDLFGTDYGIGVQAGTLYFRTDGNGFVNPGGNFSWFAGGQHSDTMFDPGAATSAFETPKEMMRLDNTGQLTVFGDTANGVQGNSASAFASGVYGENKGQGYGVAGRTTGTGTAVYGDNVSQTGWAGFFNGNVQVNGEQRFGSQTRQMLNLYNTSYGIGVQAANLYFRTDSSSGGGGFAWYQGGTHNNAAGNSGGGQTLMKLDNTGTLNLRNELTWGRSRLTPNQGGAIELGPELGTGQTPFIDFHFGKNASEDYNVRLINDEDGQLSAYGNFRVTGRTTTGVLTITGGADVAEPFKMSTRDLPRGSVVVIDDSNPGHLKLSEGAYDTRVAGIISGAGGVNPGISLSQQGIIEGDQNVALSGRVYVQADASTGPIKPGDLLTTSDLPGHAMKVTDSTRSQGAILGKAMTSLTNGQGLVLVLVTLQ